MSSGVGSNGQLGRGPNVVSAKEFGLVSTSEENSFIYISCRNDHSAAITSENYKLDINIVDILCFFLSFRLFVSPFSILYIFLHTSCISD